MNAFDLTALACCVLLVAAFIGIRVFNPAAREAEDEGGDWIERVLKGTK